MDDLFSPDELAQVQRAALILGVSQQEFLRKAGLAMAIALAPETGQPPAPAVQRGLTPLDL